MNRHKRKHGNHIANKRVKLMKMLLYLILFMVWIFIHQLHEDPGMLLNISIGGTLLYAFPSHFICEYSHFYKDIKRS